MQVKLELTVACDQLEDILQARYNLTEPVKVVGMEYDELSDVCAFELEVEAADSRLICRQWDDYAFSEDFIGEAI
jgi:hypothetical protein